MDLTQLNQTQTHSVRAAEIDDNGYSPDDVPTEQDIKKNFSGDWLFHVRTTACHGDAFDNGVGTRISRTFLPVLSITCVAFVLFSKEPRERRDKDDERDADKIERADGGQDAGPHDSTSGQVGQAVENDANATKPKAERLYHVDFARICAVMCVIFEHSGGISYTHRNVGFGLWWALPFLYVTSGMSSMMTKSSMCAYAFRLLIVFSAGVSANLFADIVNDRDWRHDFGNTIFQMFFVVMLLIMAPLAEPLRQALRARSNEHDEKATTSLFTIFWGTVLAGSLAFFVRGVTGDTDIVTETFKEENVSRWIQFYAPVLRRTPIILVHVGGTLFLSLLGAMVCHRENTGMIGWILLAFTYLQMIVIPWDQDSFAHLVSLNIVGMVTFQWPLAGSKKIALLVKLYWPFLLMILCLDSMPDMWGRCDVHSPYSTWERFRMFFGEFTLVVCFIAGAFTPSDPNGVTAWLNVWSLYAYCFHVMWYRLFGSPYGAIITFAGIPMFYLIHKLSSASGASGASGTSGRAT